MNKSIQNILSTVNKSIEIDLQHVFLPILEAPVKGVNERKKTDLFVVLRPFTAQERHMISMLKSVMNVQLYAVKTLEMFEKMKAGTLVEDDIVDSGTKPLIDELNCRIVLSGIILGALDTSFKTDKPDNNATKYVIEDEDWKELIKTSKTFLNSYISGNITVKDMDRQMLSLRSKSGKDASLYTAALFGMTDSLSMLIAITSDDFKKLPEFYNDIEETASFLEAKPVV